MLETQAWLWTPKETGLLEDYLIVKVDNKLNKYIKHICLHVFTEQASLETCCFLSQDTADAHQAVCCWWLKAAFAAADDDI